MIVDPKYKGVTCQPFEFELEAGKIRDFAGSLGAYLPEHQEGGRPIAPPTFLVVAAYQFGQWIERPSDPAFAAIGLKNHMSYDGGQTFSFENGPLTAGEVLTGQTTIDDIWEKTGRRSGHLTFVRIRTDFRDTHGNHRATWTATSALPEHGDLTEAEPYDGPLPDRPSLGYGEKRKQFLAIERGNVASLVEGDTPGPLQMPALTLTEISRYGFFSGEDGASHHDDVAARKNGYPQAFSIGMLHAGMLGTYISAWCGPETITSFQTRFVQMIWPGDELTYEGVVVNVEESNDRRHVDIELRCLRDGEPVVVGEARCTS